MKIDQRSALVTGGASGLGLATARRLVASGALVVIADLNEQLGESAARELGSRVRYVPTDVTREDHVASALTVAEDIGHFGIVVNCAGVSIQKRVVGRNTPFPLAEFRQILDINLAGTFNVIRLAAERMIMAGVIVDEERGVIVNTASVAAFEGQVGQAAYSASKAGIVGMTLPVARDLAQFKIRVATIAPGLFLTPLFAGLGDHVASSLGEQVPHPQRLGDPSEFAALVTHIVENPMLNGETIRLDGALRMAPR